MTTDDEWRSGTDDDRAPATDDATGAERRAATDCCARSGGWTGDVVLARRDYTCGACGEVFALDDQSADAQVVCPACGSSAVREHWESRLRNSGGISPERLEELRDRPG